MLYESYNEIINQSEAMGKTCQSVRANADSIRAILSKPGDIVFLGCGSSYWLSLSASKTFSLLTGRRTYALKAGDVLMNFDEHKRAYENPILICPSRSGSSTEQLESIKLFRQAYGDVSVLSAVIYQSSELEKLSTVCVNLPWANEISVCQTRSFNCLYLAMLSIASIASGNQAFSGGMARFVDVSAALFTKGMEDIKGIVDAFPAFDHLIALGSGRQYGVVIEGAYISIEMAQLNANYYSVLELRHGPIVTVTDHTLVVILCNGKNCSLEESTARDVRRHGCKVLAVVGNGGFNNADWVFELGGEYPSEAVALYFVQLMQAFAYWQALRLNLDPDHPGDLVPFIKL